MEESHEDILAGQVFLITEEAVDFCPAVTLPCF